MRKSSSQWKVTMVNLRQLKKRRYTGFKTPKAIQQFCSRYHINAFWWKPPQGTKKIFMIDEQNFRRCYNEVHNFKTSHKTSTRKPTTSTWKNRTKPVRLNAKKRTYSTRSYTTRKTYRRAA